MSGQQILVVDDELSMREYLELLLVGAGHQVTTASGEQAALVQLEQGAFDLVVSDMKLGSGSGMSVLRAARDRKDAPEVILITAFGTPAAAVEAMRSGAYDYISKPFDNDELLLLVERALEKRALRRENDALRVKTGVVGIGDGERMQAVWRLVDKVAQGRTTVLITGESGTGKELVARAIHAAGPRASRPFIPFNCAALSEGVLESELFGHVKGAFTGATQDRPGLLVSAQDGTILLDEVGEMPHSTQVKLLRVLQERTVKPVGGAREIPFEARILAATHRKLENEVREGRFREDLLYRLNVISIELPPLRERREDVTRLARHFLSRMAEELGRPGLRFSEEALALLTDYRFPGNVRQLQNLVERAAVLSDDDVLDVNSLPATLRGEEELPKEVHAEREPVLEPGFRLDKYLDDRERFYLRASLEKAEGVKTRAAELLGLSFRSFRYRLAKHSMGEGDELDS